MHIAITASLQDLLNYTRIPLMHQTIKMPDANSEDLSTMMTAISVNIERLEVSMIS